MNPIVIPRPMTAEQFFEWSNLPENRDRHFELEQGKVVEVSRPGERHGLVCGNVGFILNAYVRQRGQGYVCTNDAGLILGRDPDTVRGPDVALYLRSRRYEELHVQYSDEPPELAVEVLSPHDRWGKITRKVAQFLNQGVKMVWLVDPEDRTVAAHRASQLPQVYEGADELAFEDLLPGFRCKASEFFWIPGEEAAQGSETAPRE